MNKIYLDYNIFLDILERESNDFILPLRNKGFVFVYSPAHIEEIARGLECGKVSREQSLSNLNGIGELTENIELLPYYSPKFNVIESPYGNNGIQVVKEEPNYCYERVYGSIKSNRHAKNAQKTVIMEGERKFSHLSESERQDSLDNINKLDPIVDILKTNECIDKLINGFITLQAKSDTMIELIQNGVIKHPLDSTDIELIDSYASMKITNSNGYYNSLATNLLTPPSECFNKIKGNFSFIENMIDIVMRELLRYGYKLEKIKKSESSLHDHTHAIYATACDYFICRDKRLLSKTKATYSYLGVKTKVLDANIEGWWQNI
ncbi:hypothetical protein MT216_005137 [Escherichia coli]|nr:hypothetical protein [Escherichia coli]